MTVKRFFQIVGFPLRLVFGLAVVLVLGVAAMFVPDAALRTGQERRKTNG
jgi:hypothetical protein